MQICFQFSADFIQPSFHLFRDVVIIIIIIIIIIITEIFIQNNLSVLLKRIVIKRILYLNNR